MNKKPVVLVVMDGVGETPETLGNMVVSATTPTLDELKANHPWQVIKAHGGAVGLPSDDDMGNSEVGHNALGCGQVYSQGAKLVGESIENGSLYASATAVSRCLVASCDKSTMVEYSYASTKRYRQLLPDNQPYSM